MAGPRDRSAPLPESQCTSSLLLVTTFVALRLAAPAAAEEGTHHASDAQLLPVAVAIDPASDDAQIVRVAPCPADVDGDGVVGPDDLLAVVCPDDTRDDAGTAILDLIEVMSAWGSCNQGSV